MQIHIDAKNGNIKGVLRALDEGAPVDSIDEDSKLTPLMVALGSKNAGIDMVRCLIEKGADINRMTRLEHYHTYPLAAAVQHGDLEKVILLLESGADLHYKTPENYDVLIDAMFHPGFVDEPDIDLYDVIEFLLREGAPKTGQTYLIGSTKKISALSLASDMCRYDIIKLMLHHGADSKQLEWNPLMEAVVLGTLNEVKSCLTDKSLLDNRDVSLRTPFLLSVLTGDISKAEYLLSAGSDRQARGFMDRTPFSYAIMNEDLDMMTWLARNHFDVNEPGGILENTPLVSAIQIGSVKCIERLLALGADLNKRDERNKKPIAHTDDQEIMRLLIRNGAKFADIGDNMRKQFRGTTGPWLDDLPKSLYLEQKHRVFGKTNPEVMDIDFWKAMVISGCAAWQPRYKFDDKDVYEHRDKSKYNAVWCFDRFGMSITEVPDGRVIEIAGEHEDSYDPDFCIYNDVVVHFPDGTFTIYGYPKDIFPTTDFHSATLVGDYIYIIGNLGYMKQRQNGITPVYRLNTVNYKIEKVETTGEAPGWISRHDADLIDQNTIRVSGGKLWALKDEKELAAAKEKKPVPPVKEESYEKSTRRKKRKYYFKKRSRDNSIDKYIDNTSCYLLDLKTLKWSKE
ncbi:MAG: ankyrin repeat domain-containing protein [Candidatus Aminicenantes bacterium]|jgi:ankyrin repeat protein